MAKAAKNAAPKVETKPAAAATETPVVAAKVGRGRKSDEPEAYGVRRPGAGTQTRAVWELIDSMLGKENEIPTRGDVLKAAEERGMNVSTASTQYGKYRIFHGLGPEPKAPKVTKETPAAPPAVEVAEEAPVVEESAEAGEEEAPEEEASDEDGDVID